MEEKHEHEHHAHKSEGLTIKKSDLWKSIATVLAILLVVSLYFNFAVRPNSGGGAALAANEAATKAVTFINNNLLQPGTTAKLVNVTKKDNLYLINIDIRGKNFETYTTYDGALLFPSAVDMTLPIEKPATAEETAPPAEVTKSDKPVVELFVMTYCPFGTQAEKGIIPAIDAVKDAASVTIRFVHYFMHGDKEEQETYTQICIREEQASKFLPYLKCFLEAGDSAGCVTKTGVDSAALATCKTAKAKDYYAVDSALSNKYGVQGSPTLVINGGQADFYPRSPAIALSTICSAFNTQPTECSQKLSTDNPSSGFGYTATAAASNTAAASCGT
jgi:hypothetical protein